MDDQRLRVLDIVRLLDHPNLIADGSAGRLGIVSLVRQMDDGSFRYEVMNLFEEDLDLVPGIYDADMLAGTGDTASLEQVDFMPPGLHVRDLVTVGPDCDEPDLVGHTVLVDGGVSEDEHGHPLVGVWCEQLQEAFSIPPRFLTPTGVRLEPAPLGRRVTSTRVTEGGEAVGTSAYTVVDDLDNLR
jgi:hypothetical protein